jgi:hypothetical protein
VPASSLTRTASVPLLSVFLSKASFFVRLFLIVAFIVFKNIQDNFAFRRPDTGNFNWHFLRFYLGRKKDELQANEHINAQYSCFSF